MDKKKSQKKIILELLENRGYQGIHSFEGYKQLYIPRISARIYDLRKDGVEIIERSDRENRGVIYYLKKFEKQQPNLFQEKPTLKDWSELILPENKKTKNKDARKILIKSRYSKN